MISDRPAERPAPRSGCGVGAKVSHRDGVLRVGLAPSSRNSRGLALGIYPINQELGIA